MPSSIASLWTRAPVEDSQPVQTAPRLFVLTHDEDRSAWQQWVHQAIPSPVYKARLQGASSWLLRHFRAEQILAVNVGPPWPQDLAVLFGCVGWVHRTQRTCCMVVHVLGCTCAWL